MKARWNMTLLGAALAVFAVGLISATLAYFTDTLHITNTLGVGITEAGKRSLLISLEEPSFAAHADDTTYLISPNRELSAASKGKIVPGQWIYQDPVVKNIGSVGVYIRVKFGDLTQTQIEKLTGDKNAGLGLGLEFNATFQKKLQDGSIYYYYADSENKCIALAPGESLELFKTQGSGTNKYSMTVPITWSNDNLTSFFTAMGTADSFRIPIEVQAIQAPDFDGNAPWMEGGQYVTSVDSAAASER